MTKDFDILTLEIFESLIKSSNYHKIMRTYGFFIGGRQEEKIHDAVMFYVGKVIKLVKGIEFRI